MGQIHQFDAFISYATEDKDTFVRPLALKLKEEGLDVWFDEFCLKVGDSLTEKIDLGLGSSRFGVVILSPNFFRKSWPRHELDALYTRQVDGHTLILPVWKDVSRQQVASYSTLLADKLAAKAYEGIDKVASQLIEVIDPKNRFPEKLTQQELQKAVPENSPSTFDVRVNAQAGMKVVNVDGMPGRYDSQKMYITISVANWGTRDVIISKAGLHQNGKERQFLIASDSMLYGPRRLHDGATADYLIEQELVDLSAIDYAWAMDQVGREWRGPFKIG
jgi:hypothetical protein